MDITSSLAPRSDQLNADDLIGGPITVTIKEVTPGKAEQPFDFQLIEYPGRAYRPSLGMRRVIAHVWGGEASEYAGRKLTLYRDPDVTFGKDRTGGIRISHMSNISEPVSLPVTVSRGRRVNFTVQPLKERDWIAELEMAGDDIGLVTALGTAAKNANVHPSIMNSIIARYNALKKV